MQLDMQQLLEAACSMLKCSCFQNRRRYDHQHADDRTMVDAVGGVLTCVCGLQVFNFDSLLAL
jgi:hypothetical protein